MSLTEEADKTKGCVLVAIRQILECIYDNQIGTSPRIKSGGGTQQTGYLAGDDVESRASHKARHCWSRDEFDDPAKAEETNSEDNKTTDEGERGGDLWTRPMIGVSSLDVSDDLADLERHDCNRTDGYILRGGAMIQRLVQGVGLKVLVGTNKN